MSKEYLVKVPFAGYVSMVVAAESEEAAVDAALGADITIDMREGETDYGIEVCEWDLYRHTGQGNVCYLPLWHAEAEEV